MGCHDRELSILFTDDARMTNLNSRYLGREGPTNVLAFPMALPEDGAGFEQVMLGDVVISVDTARKEAEEAGETLELTVDRLLIHGILHLMGHDHEGSEAEALRMENEENRLLRLIQGEV